MVLIIFEIIILVFYSSSADCIASAGVDFFIEILNKVSEDILIIARFESIDAKVRLYGVF
jgi:hypothetical protein